MNREKLRKFIDRQQDIVVWLFAFGFLFFMGFGASYGWTQYFLSRAETTTGTVVDARTSVTFDKGKATNKTSFQYRFYAGDKEYTFWESESFPSQKRGETYPIYYDPSNPSNATDGRRGGTLTVMGLGLLTMLITLVIARRNREKKPPPGADTI